MAALPRLDESRRLARSRDVNRVIDAIETALKIDVEVDRGGGRRDSTTSGTGTVVRLSTTQFPTGVFSVIVNGEVKFVHFVIQS